MTSDRPKEGPGRPKIRISGRAVGYETTVEVIFPDGEVRELSPVEVDVQFRGDKLTYATVTLEVDRIDLLPFLED